MNTTDHDPIENDLRALRRRELPAEWRQEILRPVPVAHRPPPAPRWLVAGWGMAWAAIALLYFTTPSEPEHRFLPAITAPAAPARQWEERLAVMEKLLAAN